MRDQTKSQYPRRRIERLRVSLALNNLRELQEYLPNILPEQNTKVDRLLSSAIDYLEDRRKDLA